MGILTQRVEIYSDSDPLNSTFVDIPVHKGEKIMCHEPYVVEAMKMYAKACPDSVMEAIDEYDLEGDFVTFDQIGLMMWLPDFLTPAMIPEEQPNQDLFIGYFTPEDESAYVSVVFQPADIILDDYREVLESMGDLIEDIDDFVINGMPFLCYYIPSGDSMCLSTVVDGQGLVEFTFAPISDEDMNAYAEIMGVSIQEME